MTFLLLSLFVLSGCKTELWINKDGSGKGTLSGVPTDLYTKSSIKDELKSQGFRPTSVTEKKGKLYAKFTWKDFKVLGEEIIKEKDGSIYLDFGDTCDITTIVHVPGKILQTTGRQIRNNTVEFQPSIYYRGATITYKPYLGFPKFILGVAIIVAIIAIGYRFLIAKKPALASATIGKYVPKESKTSYCSQCGAEISTDSAFCGKCGHSLK